MSVKNIDETFWREAVPESVGKSLSASVSNADNDFKVWGLDFSVLGRGRTWDCTVVYDRYSR